MKALVDHNTAFAQTCPLLLTDNECADPFSVIEEFFNFSSLYGYREELSKWFGTALNEEVRYDRPSTLIFIHNQFVALLNAGFLIASSDLRYQPDMHSDDEPFSKQLIRFSAIEAKSVDTSAFNPAYWLKEHQRENPYNYIKETLTIMKVANLRYGLKEWLSAAASDELNIQDIGHEYSFQMYEELNKILEAFYFILIADTKLNSE